MNKSTGIILLVLIVILGAGYLILGNQTTVVEEPEESKSVRELLGEELTDSGTTNMIIKTNMGNIVIELFTEQMPITTGNFRSLAEAGFYDGIKFHRVIPGFMAQVGDPLTKDDSLVGQWGTGGPGYTIEDEFVAGLSNVRGTLSMANTGQPNSGGSQLFINVADNTQLDFDKEPAASRHPVFARVIEGMDVVDAIVAVPTEGQDRPIDPVVIESVIYQ